MAAASILDFWILKILLADGVLRAQAHHCAKFHYNRSICCRDIAIFRIFKMAAAAILYFCNCKILLANGVQRVEAHQHSKIGQNRSIICKDIKIFRFLKWRPYIMDLFGAYLDHPHRLLGGLCHSANCGFDLCNSFYNMNLSVFGAFGW